MYSVNIQDPSMLLCTKGKGKVTDQADAVDYEVEFLNTFYCLPGKELKLSRHPEEEFEVFIATIAE